MDMHAKEARRDGLSELWINLVSVWRESPVFDRRERAVLGWKEVLTSVAQARTPEIDVKLLSAFFSEAEMQKMTGDLHRQRVEPPMCRFSLSTPC